MTRNTTPRTTLTLTALPAFDDNYIWLLRQDHDAVAVDPGDAQAVQAALDADGLRLRAILVTHHHADHTGGVAELHRRTGAEVYGPLREDIPAPFTPLTPHDPLTLLGHGVEVLDVPGHTAGHIAYVLRPAGQDPLLFCGDTLFSGGCGRLFEGTPAQMLASLDALAALPDATRVCCAHEYTLANLRFALAVEPNNTALQAYAAECQARRARGQPTLPARLDRERQINPFLRSRHDAVRAAVVRHAGLDDVQACDDATVFAALREWKNNFR